MPKMIAEQEASACGYMVLFLMSQPIISIVSSKYQII